MSKTIGLTIMLVYSTAGADAPRMSPGVPGWKGNPVTQARLEKTYGELPLVFEPNSGQVDRRVKWLARSHGYTLFLTEREAVIALPEGGEQPWSAVRMRLSGSRPWGTGEGLEPTGGISNYFIGNDPNKWRRDIPHYRRVKCAGVYPGIDLVFYGNSQRLEYDFVVEPGADHRRIRLAYQGVRRIEVEANGDIVLTTHSGAELRQPRPRVYQDIGGRKVEVAGVYEIFGPREVAIRVGFYDAGRPLVIDPALVYSSRLGGTYCYGIAVDEAGSAYVTGMVQSASFPTQQPYQGSFQGGSQDAFVTKLAPAGNALVYSTFLGGRGGDRGYDIAVDAAGSAYVTGWTDSNNFPTQSPYQTGQGGVDAFVTKLAPAGNALVYSTYLGGSGTDDEGHGIAVDGAGSAYVTGWTNSPNFPTRSPCQTYEGGYDAFVTKLTPAGNALAYSTYLGGFGTERGYAIAVDGAGSAYVTGFTTSPTFPTQSPYQTHQGGSDAFVTKLTAAGNALDYSTYLGGSATDEGRGIAVDRAGSAYVTGTTDSPNFPTQSRYQASQGDKDAFVTKLAPTGNALLYSTYLGGSGWDEGHGIALDGAGSAYVTGYTASANFPTQTPFQRAQGPFDAFVSRLTPAGNELVYSTYLGGGSNDWGLGIAVDGAGSSYVTGYTGSTDFPTYRGYPQGGGVFVTKFEPVSVPGPVVGAVVNAASYLAGPVAPGEIVTFFGNDIGPPAGVGARLTAAGFLDNTIGETRVLFDGIAGPMIFARSDQVSAVAPYAVAGKRSTQAQIEYRGVKSSPYTLAVAESAPGIFTAGSTGSGQGAILNQDGSLNSGSNPARRGSIVVLYATGEGETSPPGVDGKVAAAPFPRPLLPVSVTIGGLPAEVLYAGGAPGLVAGLLQVNARVPEGVTAAPTVPVTLVIGGAQSQPSVTVAVQ